LSSFLPSLTEWPVYQALASGENIPVLLLELPWHESRGEIPVIALFPSEKSGLVLDRWVNRAHNVRLFTVGSGVSARPLVSKKDDL